MKKHGLTFGVMICMAMICSTPARADIEAIQAVITALGDVVEGAQEQITKAKSLIENVQQLSTQAKKFASDAKQLVDEGKKTVESVKTGIEGAKAKAEEIKNKATAFVDGVKSGDLGAIKENLGNVEFAKFNDVFDGTKIDDEMADAVLDVMTRKKGDDSIESQKELSKAINQKNGIDMANMFAKTIVLRQTLRDESDEFENPTSVDEAIKLAQEAQLSAMKRCKEILNMEATTYRFDHTQAIQSIRNDYGEEKDE